MLYFTDVTDNSGSCRTDCAGGVSAPTTTLAAFTPDDSSGMHFFDESLVDEYNLTMLEASRDAAFGAGNYAPTVTSPMMLSPHSPALACILTPGASPRVLPMRVAFPDHLDKIAMVVSWPRQHFSLSFKFQDVNQYGDNSAMTATPRRLLADYSATTTMLRRSPGHSGHQTNSDEAARAARPQRPPSIKRDTYVLPPTKPLQLQPDALEVMVVDNTEHLKKDDWRLSYINFIVHGKLPWSATSLGHSLAASRALGIGITCLQSILKAGDFKPALDRRIKNGRKNDWSKHDWSSQEFLSHAGSPSADLQAGQELALLKTYRQSANLLSELSSALARLQASKTHGCIGLQLPPRRGRLAMCLAAP
ncbi:hypothetical protein EJB05_49307, partial [Eragrostis curvula]